MIRCIKGEGEDGRWSWSSNLNLDLNWWSGASKERGRVVGGRDLLTEDSVPTSHWPAASLTIRNWKQIQSEKIKKSMITAENKWCRKSFPWGESLAGVDRPTQKNCIWIFICCPRQIQKTKQGNLLAGRRVVVRKVPSGACWWEEVEEEGSQMRNWRQNIIVWSNWRSHLLNPAAHAFHS